MVSGRHGLLQLSWLLLEVMRDQAHVQSCHGSVQRAAQAQQEMSTALALPRSLSLRHQTGLLWDTQELAGHDEGFRGGFHHEDTKILLS